MSGFSKRRRYTDLDDIILEREIMLRDKFGREESFYGACIEHVVMVSDSFRCDEDVGTYRLPFIFGFEI